MPCSHCRQTGHNKTTCPTLPASSSATPKPTKKPYWKSTKKPTKKPAKKSPIVLDTVSKGNQFYKEKIDLFKENREEQYNAALEIHSILKSGKNVAVKAEEKSGKREIMECVHCLLNMECDFTPSSVYVTALDRKDTKVQFVEQETYGITSLVARDFGPLLSEVVKLLEGNSNTKVFIHLDEDDYGSGDKQNLAKIYGFGGVERDRVKFIGYSATPEELEKSLGFETDWVPIQFTPSPSYFGAQKYLERGLVRTPHTFFDGSDFTDHGIEIVADMKSNCESHVQSVQQRNVNVIRDVTPKNLAVINSRKSEFEQKFLCEIHVYDMHTEMKWGSLDSWKNLGKRSVEDEDGNHISYTYLPVLIFISQTCTRSTEIHPSGHRRIYAWHDVRKLKKDSKGDKVSNYNTLSQAIGRVKHYTQPGYPENNILLYCDKTILEFTLNPGSVKGKIKLSARVKTTVTKQPKKTTSFEDGYGDVSEVPDPDWQNGDPNTERPIPLFQEVDGKWCHYDKKPRFWGDAPPGGGGVAGRQQVLQYENPTSERYFIRTVIFTENSAYGEEGISTFETTGKSMYS